MQVIVNHAKLPMKILVHARQSAIRLRRAVSSTALLLTSVLVAWVAFPEPITAAMLPGSKPKEWPADPTKHQVSIRREATDDKQSAMIAAAEAAQPSQEALRKAAAARTRNQAPDVAQPQEAPLPAGDKVWWDHEQLGIRIPFAITADAVAYFSEWVEKSGKQPLMRYTQPSSRLDYRAGVKFHKEFKLDEKTFNEVHVVTLKLTFSQNFVATQTEGMQFEKDRVVILDAKGKVLHISGDGPSEVAVLAI